ncbi:MAG: type II toxin-antitoxin system VapC family toxin [Deltaproteobacteria bacterium]|nr:type II toxin-antitoxin system VapC family toxin [Deltaproteobacteria bacterium]MBW2218781.1 type II toxin-antitoxin system VapC family toxin [Deltaproteobacteria bacterium]
MARSFLLDTDVLIDFFRGYSKAVTFVNRYSSRIIISSIVVAELYAGVKEGAEQTALENFVSLFRVIPVTAAIAKAGGFYKRDYGTSHGVGLADAIIAATSEAENAELKTLNIKHYPMIKSLTPAYKK